MSERTVLRRFIKGVGETPARPVRCLRLDRARALLEQTDLPAERVAQQSGFGLADAVERMFRAGLRTSPGEFRSRFGGGAGDGDGTGPLPPVSAA